MANKTINDLRAKLFEALDALTDKDNPMDVKRAQAVANMAQAIISSAKLELDHQKITGHAGSGFIPDAPALPAPGGNGEAKGPPRLADLPKRTHRLA
jgi:hypothetical protein